MDRPSFDNQLRACLPGDRIQLDAPLAPLTTFKVGGPADWLIDIRSTDELRSVLAAARAADVPVTVLGGGSNVLIGDRGIRGAVVRLRCLGIAEAGRGVRAEAGVTMNGLVRWTIGRGMGALEAWAGTPGTLGGALYGNAHYGGRNIGDLIESVELCARDGELRTVSQSEMAFAYDASRLQRTGEIALAATIPTTPADPETLRATARASLAYRKRTQPLDTPSAGCIFQNPVADVDRWPADVPWSAGALVDRAGLKGRVLGGARISPAHANFLLNDGRSTAGELRELIELARETVRERFGIELRNEVVVLGDF